MKDHTLVRDGKSQRWAPTAEVEANPARFDVVAVEKPKPKAKAKAKAKVDHG